MPSQKERRIASSLQEDGEFRKEAVVCLSSEDFIIKPCTMGVLKRLLGYNTVRIEDYVSNGRHIPLAIKSFCDFPGDERSDYRFPTLSIYQGEGIFKNLEIPLVFPNSCEPSIREGALEALINISKITREIKEPHPNEETIKITAHGFLRDGGCFNGRYSDGIDLWMDVRRIDTPSSSFDLV